MPNKDISDDFQVDINCPLPPVLAQARRRRTPSTTYVYTVVGGGHNLGYANNYQEASNIAMEMCERENLASSTYPNVNVVNNNTGRVEARISYNGRVWGVAENRDALLYNPSSPSGLSATSPELLNHRYAIVIDGSRTYGYARSYQQASAIAMEFRRSLTSAHWPEVTVIDMSNGEEVGYITIHGKIWSTTDPRHPHPLYDPSVATVEQSKEPELIDLTPSDEEVHRFISDLDDLDETFASSKGKIEKVAQEAEEPETQEFEVIDEVDPYLVAVKKGDMKTAQRMVDEAAKNAGYTLETWRGDRSGDVNEFSRRREPGIFTSQNQDFAKEYSKPYGVLRRFYVKAGKVLDLANPGFKEYKWMKEWGENFDDWTDRTTGEKADVASVIEGGHLFDWEGDWSARRWGDLQKSARGDGYDVLIVPDAGRTEDNTSTIILNDRGIKLADPVLFDDAGKVIPLSKRFNPSTSDIRYEDSAPVIREASIQKKAQVDFSGNSTIDALFYQPASKENVKKLASWLNTDLNRFVNMYHGTSMEHPVMNKGLLPTSPSRRNSLQSANGYVYLSVYPEMAQTFAEMAYPGKDIVIYRVSTTVRRLRSDKDQLRNQRQYGGLNVGDSLAESLIYGHGARIEGKIDPMQLTIYKEIKTAENDFGIVIFGQTQMEFNMDIPENVRPIAKEDLDELRFKIANEANKILNDWRQDAEGIDAVYGSGGPCDDISRLIAGIFAEQGYSVTEGGQDGDDHSFVIVYDEKTSFVVDIPAEVYETGSGYVWHKRPNAKIGVNDVVIYEIGLDGIPMEKNASNEIEKEPEVPSENQDFEIIEEPSDPYLAAVERGDMETAQKMVEDAANKAGYTIRAYHGTGTTIEEFDPKFAGGGNDQYGSGFYFTSSLANAKGHETLTLPGETEKIGGMDNPNTINAALMIKNPIRITCLGADDGSTLRNFILKKPAVERIIAQAPNIFDPDESPLMNWLDNNGKPYTMKHVKEVAKNYDNPLHIENDFYSGHPTEFRNAMSNATGYDGVEITFQEGMKHWVVWQPNQIKRIDTVIRDSKGEVVPLSRRFNPGSNNINASSDFVIKTAQSDVSANEAFKSWFGGSKVVNADGTPKVVYHGTNKKFRKFNLKKTSQGIFWFTDNKNAIEANEVGAQGQGVVVEVYLSIKNPAGWDEYGKKGIWELKRDGYDGVILPDEGETTYVAFEPTQIKSVKNRGSYDSKNANITASGNFEIKVANDSGRELEERAKKIYPLSDSVDSCEYLLSDGDGIVLNNDHRTISELFEEGVPEGYFNEPGSSSGYMLAFMGETGSMRVRKHGGTLAIDFIKNPTYSQIRKTLETKARQVLVQRFDKGYSRLSYKKFIMPEETEWLRAFLAGESYETEEDIPENMREASVKDELKGWFGNSKVVDSEGKPLVVYHGSKNPMTESFSHDYEGTGAVQGRKRYDGFFFTSDPENAYFFADQRELSEIQPEDISVYGEFEEFYYVSSDEEGKTLINGGPFKTADEAENAGKEHSDRYNNALRNNEEMFVRGYYLKIRYPLEATREEMIENHWSPSDLIPLATDAGYDGVIVRDYQDGAVVADTYIVFDGSQVKPAKTTLKREASSMKIFGITNSKGLTAGCRVAKSFGYVKSQQKPSDCIYTTEAHPDELLPTENTNEFVYMPKTAEVCKRPPEEVIKSFEDSIAKFWNSPELENWIDEAKQTTDHKGIKIGEHEDLTIYLINGDVIKRESFMDFVEGGNDEVYGKGCDNDFMPDDTIWLDADLALRDLPYVCMHELVERYIMNTTGAEYDDAHEQANAVEYEYRNDFFFEDQRNVLDFPRIKQSDGRTCGHTCICMMLQYCGIEAKIEEIVEKEEAKDKDGLEPDSIVRIFGEYKVKSEIKKDLSVDDIRDLIDEDLPVLMEIQANPDKDVNLKESWNYGHYVIAIGYTSEGIFLADPLNFYRTFLTDKEVEDRWHNIDEGEKNEHLAIVIHKKDDDFNTDKIEKSNSTDFDIIITGRLNRETGVDDAPAKGHLDTQLFPDCVGTKFDRDVVGKNRRRNKKRRRKMASTGNAVDLDGELIAELNAEYLAKWTPVESSLVNAVAYDPEKKKIEFKLNNGKKYSYFGVTKLEYDSFLNADSKGKWFSNFARWYKVKKSPTKTAGRNASQGLPELHADDIYDFMETFLGYEFQKRNTGSHRKFTKPGHPSTEIAITEGRKLDINNSGFRSALRDMGWTTSMFNEYWKNRKYWLRIAKKMGSDYAVAEFNRKQGKEESYGTEMIDFSESPMDINRVNLVMSQFPALKQQFNLMSDQLGSDQTYEVIFGIIKNSPKMMAVYETSQDEEEIGQIAKSSLGVKKVAQFEEDDFPIEADEDVQNQTQQEIQQEIQKGVEKFAIKFWNIKRNTFKDIEPPTMGLDQIFYSEEEARLVVENHHTDRKDGCYRIVSDKTGVRPYIPKLKGSLWLNDISSIPEGFNPTMEGSLSLDSVTSIPEWFNPTVGGCLSLNRVDSIPESFNPTVGFDLGLGSLKNIPENWNPTNVKGKILIGGKKFRSGPHGMIMDNADFWNSSANSSLGITKTAAKWGRAGSGVLYYCPDDNTVMLLERSDAVEDPGLWGIPGGAIKGTEGMYDEKEDLDGEKFDDETLRSSAHTEVEEEIGHKPEGGKEMGQVTLSFGNFNYTTFIVSVDKEQKEAITNGAKLNWESIGINWFPLSQLPAKTHPGVSGAIKKFFGRKTKTAQNESGKLYWKAHLASDFKKGTPVKNNGVGEGGHVFSDFDKMINKLGRKWYWFAPIIMSNDEVVDEGNGVFEAKVSKSSIGDFAPVEYWEKHKETLNA